ncbi:MAG: dihydroorotate dehydrogenase [Candidatus Aminicenantaceae bacterium]
MSTDLSIDLGFLTLKNPVIGASGTFGYGIEFAPFMDLNQLGGFVVKGLYMSPKEGNPPPRLVETHGGLINAIGLQGAGVKRFCREILPELTLYDTAVIINICGSDEDEYTQVADYLNQHEGIAAYELNISCPNVRQGGGCPAMSPESTFRIVKNVKKISRRPVITKLSPNVTRIEDIAVSAAEAGSDALSLINTILAMAVDPETRRPRLANIMGGLSGPAVKPIALRMVYQAARSVPIPVIGIGGISSPSDVLEFMIAGASAVQVGTANFIDPRSTLNIIRELEKTCQAKKITLKSLIGSLDTTPA